MSRGDLADISPSPKKEARGFTRIWGVAHGIAWGLLIAFLAFGVPRVELIFRDFNVDLPGATDLVIRASHLVVSLSYVFAAILPVMLGTAWFLLVKLNERGKTRAARAWSVLFLVCPMLLIASSLVALGYLLVLPQNLSG